MKTLKALLWFIPSLLAAQVATTPPLMFVAMAPCRVADTRQGQGFTGAFGPPSLASGQVRTFPIQTNTTCPVPSTAQAYSFNVTVVPIAPQYAGTLWLTLYPATPNSQPPPPNASTLNNYIGLPLANAAIVEAGTDGDGGVDVYANVAGDFSTDLVIDINGYYVPQSELASALLNELQKQAEANRQQAEKIRSLEERLAALEVLLPKAYAPAEQQ